MSRSDGEVQDRLAALATLTGPSSQIASRQTRVRSVAMDLVARAVAALYLSVFVLVV
jgi:hypothetical protein